MKEKLIYLLILFAQLSFAQNNKNNYRYANIVNPFIGTGGHGHTFPGATMPFGACQLSPDTRIDGWDGCSGYHYSDSIIYGFSHTHLSGTGCSDYGDILLMPLTKEMRLDKYQFASHFSHKKEKAHAGYYQVYLEEPKVNVELTTTLHGGVHQYIFQKEDDQYVVLDLKHRDEVLDSKIEIVDDYTIRGYRFSKAWAQNQKVFYEIQFSKPIESIQYEERKIGSNTTSIQLEKSYQCIVKFQKNITKTQSGHTVQDNSVLLIKCAISGVDEEGAHKNLIAEMPHWNFETYKTACENEWNKELSKIKIDKFENKNTATNQEVIFYTALYHCMIHPSIYNDVDGRYRGRDDKIHHTDGKFNYYTVFSLWDTYRALHPLLSILDKKRTNDFIQTFIKQYEQGGRLPIWELSSNETNCMIGYHVVSVIWDAYNKGIRDFDTEKAYEAMTKIATHYSMYEGIGLNMKLKEEFRKGAADADALESYCKFGYVRADDSHESVSKTLEYAYDDWCIAQMANALGKKKDYEYYLDRSHNWMNVFDPSTGFMRARKNACLYQPFSPYTVDNNYTEANAWQYSFYVPHDIETFRSLFGKSNHLAEKLDKLFSAKEKTEGREQSDITGLIGQYAHGNEPSHHIAYLYNYGGEMHATTEKVNFIINNFYKNEPDGLIGNEDCGQMSAWYVLSALGIYPVCPGKNEYEITEPLFDKVSINNDIVLLKEKNVEPKKIYYYSLQNKSSISHQELMKTGNKTFQYQRETGTNCGVPPFPFLINKTVPFLKNSSSAFSDSLKIEIESYSTSKSEIYFSVNNSAYKKYLKPFYIQENSTIRFYNENKKQYVQIATFAKLPSDRKIYLANNYNPSYSAGGANGLIDGIYGKLNWRAGDWQGYQGQDVEVVMAFDNPKYVKTLSAHFLEDQNAWIFYPKEVLFFASNDSVNWSLLQSIPTNKSAHEEKVSISTFTCKPKFIKAQSFKYVKLVAKNFGPMPDWHEGRGNATFIFVDEFEVE